MLNMNLQKDFFKEEIRCGHTVSTHVKKVWACELNLLQEFAKVCDKHGLHFWIDSGTLLGAIRHKGFIPWDDDIDVVMFREDYDKLVAIAHSEFKDPYLFQTAYTEKQFVRGHAQLRDTRTTAIIPEEVYKDFNQGIFIDIFVMDYVPDDEKEQIKQEWRAHRLRDKLEFRANPLRYFMNDKERLLQSIRYKIKYFTKKSFNRLYKRYEDLFRQNRADECSDVACVAWLYRCLRRDKHYYDETIYVDFEHLKMPAPKEYDKLLTAQYGDYMTPVKGTTFHGEIIFDPDTPFDVSIRMIRKDKRRIKEMFNKK